MKQLEIQLPSGDVEEVLRLTEEHRAFSPYHTDILRDGEPGWSRVTVNLPNEEVGPFVQATADAVDHAEFVLLTSSTLPIRTPLADLRQRVADVSPRSTFELVLDVLQSVGTWQGMLLYAAVSGVVAAYGVLFNLPYLLTAAMLIAPVGAPAMVCVVGVTLGDVGMVRRGSLRFVVALLVLAAFALLLGLAYDLRTAPVMMETISDLSIWSGLLGIVGGAAGAQALAQTERDSLVTATATGFLVAVSLSPPSAVLGLAVVLGRWDYVALMAFLLAMTFMGIILGGWASLRILGIGPEQPSMDRGRRSHARLLLAGAAVVLAGLWLWQAGAGTRFNKADRIREAVLLVSEEVGEAPGFHLVTADARFAPERADWYRGDGLYLQVVVTRAGGDAARSAEALRAAIARRLDGAMEGTRAFVDLSVLP